MKTVYFVRHGESTSNAGSVGGRPDDQLTDLGLKQAELIAERCSKLNLDQLVTSSMRRAVDTGNAISRRLGLKPTASSLFNERQKSPHIEGQPHANQEVQRFHEEWWQHFGDPDFHPEGTETFFDLRDRALSALRWLEEQPGQTIGVVSHGLFLRVILTAVVFGQKMTPHECRCLMHGFQTNNTGLSAIQYHTDLNQPHWSVWIWNDHTHLG